ncbi:hypothetical protein [Xanthomonas sp. WHRI 7945]|nr:hypothetical protein [Xanthomonas campestris pv. campestris]
MLPDIWASHLSKRALRSSHIISATGVSMDVRVLGLFLLLSASALSAQTRSAAGRGIERVNPNRNVTAVPKLDCRKLLASDPRPWVHAYCEHVDFAMQDGMSRAWGRPQPSSVLLDIPALGTAEAKVSGVSCSEGRVIRRVGNGWEQALDQQRNYLRCRPSVELPAISIGQ